MFYDQESAIAMLRAKLGDQEETPENVMGASIALIREGIYSKYYYAKPDVVEALLLNLRNFMTMLFAEIDEMTETSEEAQSRVIVELARFSLSLGKTIEQLYSV